MRILGCIFLDAAVKKNTFGEGEAGEADEVFVRAAGDGAEVGL